MTTYSIISFKKIKTLNEKPLFYILSFLLDVNIQCIYKLAKIIVV
jgi:hypothetical protein